jgi:hypothetical protein
MVIDTLCTSDLLELQQAMQNRFRQADAWLSDLSTDDIRQVIAYVNYINDMAHLHAGHTDFWIQLHPWSRHTWRWGAHFNPGPPEQVPPDPDPDPPDLPDEVLDEAHSAFAATVPAVSVSDAMHAHVDAASAAFAAGVHDAITAAINATPQAAFAKVQYTATPASGAGGSCFYSWSAVPSCCTHLLYSASLKMPLCRISNPSPYLSSPLDPTMLRAPSIYALAATDLPVSSHTSSGEILAIVDSGSSKHILQCRTLLANAQEAHVAVSSFAGDTSRSTYSGDLLCTVRTEDGQLLPLSDRSSALVVPDAKRPLWSVRHAQFAGHEIVLGAKPGLLLQGNPRYFVPFSNCPETGLWRIRLLPPPTLHNRIYPIHLATNSDIPTNRAPTSTDRLQDHERLGHFSFKRMRQLIIDGSRYRDSQQRTHRLSPSTSYESHRVLGG